MEKSHIHQSKKGKEMMLPEMKEKIIYQKMLLDYNIIDFTFTYELCLYLIKYAKIIQFDLFLVDLRKTIKEKFKGYQKNMTFLNFSILQNYIVFFMILVINIKDKKEFIMWIFNQKNKFFKRLLKLCKEIKALKHQNSQIEMIIGILNHLFLEEYKGIYFKEEPDPELEEIFILNNAKFSEKYSYGIPYYSNESYFKLFELLINFDISYDNFFKNQLEPVVISDRQAYKLCIAQSVIRVVFSKEKFKFYSKALNYEFDFINRVILKDMIETKEKYGDKYNTLFRKEDLCDDIIKYLFFIFGNNTCIRSFSKPVSTHRINIKPASHLIENSEECDNKLQADNYDLFFNEMIINLQESLPLVLKVVLKLVYKHAYSTFTIEVDNYSPLYTLLFFNFLVSPRVQEIYNFHPLKIRILWDLNRLLRNTCYNTMFEANDNLAVFNQCIDKYNQKLRQFIFKNIILVNEQSKDIQRSLSDLLTEQYLIYPKFLFYTDSTLLSYSITGGPKNIIVYEDT